MQPIAYARHHFPSDVIRHAIWSYLRFALSHRDFEDLSVERGLDPETGQTANGECPKENDSSTTSEPRADRRASRLTGDQAGVRCAVEDVQHGRGLGRASR